MTHLLKLTTVTLIALTPMTASADWVVMDPNALDPADLRIDPPVLIEIPVPGPDPRGAALNDGLQTVGNPGQIVDQPTRVGR
ncbi:hypothetical protein [Jannaschia sp. CCS1]|uniref:hypothetical protein n=1 Tax=Jannaschia sp. (strain CCS1) TaxID=290400 RepID=UPI000053DE28|nr:hypothetical protein [Jannaschia sp. CCS1]ABD54121.1 hypothetical protein Jann_1204 [Jannaschia sp. CCS1]